MSAVETGTRHVVALALLALATSACRKGPADSDPRTTARHVLVGGLSFSVPAGFVRKAYERSREPLLNLPGETVQQVFASWEGPGGQRLCLFYWSSLPPRDLGPMVAARRWKTTVAGVETEAAETSTFMGLEQRVFVTWLEGPGGAGRFLMYAKDVPRETFDGWLATMRFQAGGGIS